MRAVLEVIAGTARKLGIEPGDQVVGSIFGKGQLIGRRARQAARLAGRKANHVSTSRDRRGIAQPGSAAVLGTAGRRFKSCCPDHLANVISWLRIRMTARIYKPARTAMQSGTAKTKEWVLDYEPEEPRAVEPLMGWT